ERKAEPGNVLIGIETGNWMDASEESDIQFLVQRIECVVRELKTAGIVKNIHIIILETHA
ncbi:MAG: hypothetical protein HQL28_07180, partial [Candidatus Omnitrophica bacterium]|nr:hypothetical protein [Candidatus Omnitrophota bacterium]